MPPQERSWRDGHLSNFNDSQVLAGIAKAENYSWHVFTYINIIIFAYINIYSLLVVLRLDVCCWRSWRDIKRAMKCFLVHCFHFHFKRLIINLYLSYRFSIWILLAHSGTCQMLLRGFCPLRGSPPPTPSNQCEKKKVFFLSGKGGYTPPP